VAEQPLEDLLTRLERERQQADRAYNDALTEVDRAIMRAAPGLPRAPHPYDGSRVSDLNASWNLLPDSAPPADRSVKGRLRGFIWRLIGPPLETQTRFNAALVDHVNRNAESAAELPAAVAACLAVAREELEARLRFESRLVQYLQTITAFVDTKDRLVSGAELGQRLSLVEQRLLAVKRDLETRPGTPPPRQAVASAAARGGPFGESLESATYVAFEDRFRGSRAEIGGRVADYLPLLAGASDVLDVGCGRGELLEQLRDRRVPAKGVDGNRAMAELCRSRGLDVEHDDALRYLERQPDASLGGLVAIQVVEHFEPAYLVKFLQAAFHKMRSGAPLILETINAACWMAFFETYLRDLTHARPLHPDTLRYLVEASGFVSAAVQFREPVAERDRLAKVALPDQSEASGPVAALAAAVNAHADTLNARLFSHMDYALVARR
jgi:O-antigen chain-terminating methyltransferase